MLKSNGMIETIKAEAAFTCSWTGRKMLDASVLLAMSEVPRDKFVPRGAKAFAYDNHPLSIGFGQTISQPFIVALMTDLLQPQAADVILEVGTGSGYQAAILSQLVKQVYSIEYVEELATSASERLQRLGYRNVEVKEGDGSLGWAEHAPYDGIIVTAAAPAIPPALIDQLKPNARLVIPLGQPYLSQSLMSVEKDEKGAVSTRDVLAVSFVPLVGESSSCVGE